MTDDTYQARVEAGMAWLDENVPGWERKIDLATFDLTTGCDCVLGQALQDVAKAAVGVTCTVDAYNWARDKHRPLMTDPYRYGFNARDDDEWEPLEAEWRTAIKRRFDTGVLSDDGRPA